MKTRASIFVGCVAGCVAVSILVTSAEVALAAVPDGEASGTVVAAAPARASEASVDPNIDRGFLLPTAMNQPAGSMTYNNYELVLHGFTYAINDRVQGTVTVLSPIVKNMPFFGVVAVKGQVVAAPRFFLALQGSAGYGHSFSSGGSSGGGGALLGVGAFATACLRADCSSLFSASATYQYAVATSGGNGVHMILYGASIVHSVSQHLKLLGEVASATVNANVGQGFDNAPGALVSYGVRFHNANLASDVGFIKPFLTNGSSDQFVLGFPFVNISYRWE
jgi:hypothetical protein